MADKSYVKLNTFLIFQVIATLSPSLSGLSFAKSVDCPVEQLSKTVANPSHKEINDLLKVVQQAKHMAAGKSEDCKEKILFDLMNINLEMIDRYYESHKTELERLEKKIHAVHFHNSPNTEITESKEYRSVEEDIKRAGWYIAMPDGILELEPDDTWLLQQFRRQLPKSWKKYLFLLDNEGVVVRDGHVIVPWETLGDRLVSWFEFLKTYPKFGMNDEIQDKISGYAHIYFFGAEDKNEFMEIAGEQENLIHPNVISAYENFPKKYQNSDLKFLVEHYLEVLKRNQNKFAVTIREDMERRLAERGIR